jgi:hypothetical protein
VRPLGFQISHLAFPRRFHFRGRNRMGLRGCGRLRIWQPWLWMLSVQAARISWIARREQTVAHSLNYALRFEWSLGFTRPIRAVSRGRSRPKAQGLVWNKRKISFMPKEEVFRSILCKSNIHTVQLLGSLLSCQEQLELQVDMDWSSLDHEFPRDISDQGAISVSHFKEICPDCPLPIEHMFCFIQFDTCFLWEMANPLWTVAFSFQKSWGRNRNHRISGFLRKQEINSICVTFLDYRPSWVIPDSNEAFAIEKRHRPIYLQIDPVCAISQNCSTRGHMEAYFWASMVDLLNGLTNTLFLDQPV